LIFSPNDGWAARGFGTRMTSATASATSAHFVRRRPIPKHD
jgi:hypothetical protein